MKYQVNIDWGQNKSKQQSLYKEIPIGDLPLQQRQHQVLDKVNLRIYCCQCHLSITRQAHIITQNNFYCIGCFAGLSQWEGEYIVRTSLNKSYTHHSWDLMDQAVLITSLQMWGFGNISQIKQFMHYNGSIFSAREIEKHLDEFYLNQNNQLPVFRGEIRQATKKKTMQELNMENYANLPMPLQLSMRKISSRGQKKIIAPLIPVPSSEAQDASQQKKEAAEQLQPTTKRTQKIRESSLQGTVLGYNSKRRQFQYGQYDMTAQLLLADLQFNDDDSSQQFQLKLQIIQQYNRRLSQRLKRRQFVVQHHLLDSQYNFYQKNKIDSQMKGMFQPLMRWTKDHKEYQSLVMDYSMTKKYQKYVINLAKIRKKMALKGEFQSSYRYMKRKRSQFTARCQRNYGKKFAQKRRPVYQKQGEVMVDKFEGQFVEDQLIKALELCRGMVPKDLVIQVGNYQIKSLKQ